MKRLLAGLLLFASSLAFGADAVVQPIEPVFQGSATIVCGVASSATAIPSFSSGTRTIVQLEIQNAGTVPVFTEVGSSSGVAAAVASGYPTLPGQSKVITIGRGATHIACISGTAAQTVYVTVGTGN